MDQGQKIIEKFDKVEKKKVEIDTTLGKKKTISKQLKKSKTIMHKSTIRKT